MSTLLKQLRALGKEANALTENTLNLGGCCVFAAAVAQRLNELGHVAECVAPGCGTESVDRVRNNVLRCSELDYEDPRNWREFGLSFSHVGVRFEHNGNKYVYDSDVLWRGSRSLGLLKYAGGVRKPHYRVLPDGLTVEEAQAFADCKGFWNRTFDRSLIPQVRDLVQKHLH